MSPPVEEGRRPPVEEIQLQPLAAFVVEEQQQQLQIAVLERQHQHHSEALGSPAPLASSY